MTALAIARAVGGFSVAGILAITISACGDVDRPSRTNLPRAPLKHREERVTCRSTSSDAEPVLPASPTNIGCTKNADCPRGRCEVTGSSTQCVQDACVTGADCAGVAICECGRANICVAGGCLDDRDCGSGGYCSPSGCESTAAVPHYCHTTDDECFDDADCKGVDLCRYQAGSRTWRCVTTARCT